ncbi:hypothetical protein Kpho01_60270 [Kitasatospora phosalacinea]|uniref:Uncharacterized protein n=1 Tax=Kitasatospora phosalacinea TaxID=2065 RepID=A0A9W6UPZ8_9ACTN|nr:hypothetical protein Kpho01_60270 [Kitasatospora phosalacinea]
MDRGQRAGDQSAVAGPGQAQRLDENRGGGGHREFLVEFGGGRARAAGTAVPGQRADPAARRWAGLRRGTALTSRGPGGKRQ